MAKGELHRVLKPESVRLLGDVFGVGRTIFIPSSTANAEHFAIVIGAEQTSRLVEAFGGDSIYLPGVKPRPAVKFGYDKPPSLPEVRELSNGPKRLSAAKIAALFGCSDRTIKNKRQRIRRLMEKGITP
jgi:hypothetical protein